MAIRSGHAAVWLGVCVLAAADIGGINFLVDEQPDGVHVTLHNANPQALTAFAYRVGGAPAGQDIYYEDALLKNRPAVAPGAEFRLVLMTPSARGGDISLKAAIFDKGETVGDVALIQHLLAERRYVLKALNIVLEHLPPSGHETLDAFGSMREDEVRAAGDDRDVGRALMYVNTVIGRIFRGAVKPADSAPPQTVAETLRKWRDSLSTSRPSLL